MEYWTRQLEYFRNLLKNFAAAIESPEELKKLMATCNYDVNSKKCFEKLRKFFNLDKNFGKCCCNSCFDKALSQLCNALSIPAPCNQCKCSTCRRRGRKPCCAKQTCTYNCQNVPGYCYVPYQAPAYPYYYYPYQTSYCQTMPQQCNNTNNNSNCCPPNCDKCCNKCKLNNIINQINCILSSAEKMKNVPSGCGGACACNCACSCACNCACNLPRQKSCCSIKEIKEETVTITRENIVENDASKNERKPIENTTNASQKPAPTPKPDNLGICQKNPGNPNNSSFSENYHEHGQENRKRNSIRKPTKYSEDETIDDASNLSEEYRNCGTRVNKQASILLGEEYISPSGTFEVLIQDERECCDEKKKQNKRNGSNMKFQVDYTTYTKPKCFQI